MIVAYYDEHRRGVQVLMYRNEDITEDMQEVASIIASFRDALYQDVPKNIADMMITTIGKLAYSQDDSDAITEVLKELEEYLSEDIKKRHGIDAEELFDRG